MMPALFNVCKHTISTRTPLSKKLVILLCAPAMMVSVVSGAAVSCTVHSCRTGSLSVQYQTVIHVHPRMQWCHGPRLARLRVV